MVSPERRLTLFDATMIVSGAIIGAGIFINPAESARFLETSSELLFVWALAGVIAFIGGLCFAELGSLFVHSGGQYLYFEKAFSPAVGFLFGWTLFTTIQTGAIAAVAMTCARFLATFIPLSEKGSVLVAAAIIWFLSFVNFLGIKPGSLVQNIFTVLKLASLAGLVIVCFFFRPQPRAVLPLGPLFPSGLNFFLLRNLGLALMPALFSYGGWQNLNFVAGEVRNPRRTLPLAIMAGVSLVVGVYILTNLVYVSALPFEAIKGSTRVAADAAYALLGPIGSRLIAAAIVISTFGITNVFILTGPRVYQAMAREGAFLPLAGRVHPRYQSPYFSIFLQSAWASALLFTNTYSQLLQYVTFGDWIFFGLAAVALIVLRHRLPSRPDTYRVWLYPFIPAVFALVSFAVVLNVFVASPVKSLLGTGIILGGLPLYALTKRKSNREMCDEN